MRSTTEQPNNNSISLKELFFSLIIYWKLIIICILVSLSISLIYLRVTEDTYAVDALIQVKDSKGGAAAALLGSQLSEIMGSAGGLGGNQVAQAETEILRSRSILGTTIQNLNLNIVIKAKRDNLWSRLIDPIKFKTEYSIDGVKVLDENQYFIIKKFKTPSYYEDRKLLLSFVNENFIITDKKTDQVIYKGILNKQNIDSAWDIFIVSSKNLPTQSYDITKKSLTTAVKDLLENYSVTEKGKQSGILGLTYEGYDKTNITNVLNTILQVYKAQDVKRSSAEKLQTLSFLDKKLPELKKELDISEIAFNRFREQHNTVDVNQESQLYLKQSIELETQKIQLQQKQAELAAQYTAQHPMMQEINAQLGALTNKINELNSTIKRLPEIQRQYLQYYRDVQVKNQLYTNLLNTYQTLSVANAGEIGIARVLDNAVEPVKPIKPKKIITLLLTVFIGGFIGIIFSLIRSLMHTGVRNSAQIETELALPVYGAIPLSSYQPKNAKKKVHLPVLSLTHGDDIAVESLRSVRTTLAFAMIKAQNNVLLVTSSAPGAGKSFISTNLAVLFAQANKRVLLIDSDLRRGYLHKYFKVENKNGLSELLTREIDLTQAIYTTEQHGLSFMPRGSSPAHPSELLNSNLFIETLETLKSQYDYIIMDSAPILAVTDGLILAKHSGVNVFVARYAQTPLREIEIVMQRFENVDLKIDGVILNSIQAENREYQYSYNYSSHTNKE